MRSLNTPADLIPSSYRALPHCERLQLHESFEIEHIGPANFRAESYGAYKLGELARRAGNTAPEARSAGCVWDGLTS